MKTFSQIILDWWRGYAPLGSVGRSNQWPRVRKEYLLKSPVCEVCGDTKVEVHHVKPFHNNQSLELDPNNLITLCDGLGTDRHHLEFGHLGSWKSWNETVKMDATYWHAKIKARP